MKKIINNLKELREAFLYARKDFKVDTVYLLEFKKRPKKRSIPQNKLLHVWLSKWCEGQGKKNDSLYLVSVKEELKYLFAPKIECNGMVSNYERSKKTSEMSTKEFTEFLDNIHDFFLAEYSFRLPWPDDKYWNEIGY